jgi:DNA-binding response OmpR family regulator
VRSTVMQKRVLVVDDHPPTLRLITNALKGKDVDVATARNGAECLLAIENQRPDLLVLDVVMPVMDGFQTLRVIRENQATRTLPVIILSIRSEDEAVLKGLSGGADIYITKPFKMADLVTAVMRVLLVTDGT